MRAITANLVPGTRMVAIVVLDGLSMFEFAVALEVFGPQGRVAAGGPWYRLLLCAATLAPVTTRNGLQITPSRSLDALREADTVIVPPCDAPDAVPSVVLDALRDAHARGARVVSLCTGAFVLAAAGLLGGRRVATHWADSAELARRYPDVEVDAGVLYVDDGDILTSAGSAASIDLCLHLVRTDHGAAVATRLARDLVVPPYRDGGQAQYIDTPIPVVDDRDLFTDALAWAQGHLDRPVTVQDLAARSAMSRRTFARRFRATTGTTPYQWLLQQRVHRAQHLLETTDLPVDAVAARSGLVTAANLRKHFTRLLRTAPQSYRHAFQARAGAGQPGVGG
jgi:AraC family transcriptional regulator, transcriptional activator FtrA